MLKTNRFIYEQQESRVNKHGGRLTGRISDVSFYFVLKIHKGWMDEVMETPSINTCVVTTNQQVGPPFLSSISLLLYASSLALAHALAAVAMTAVIVHPSSVSLVLYWLLLFPT